MDPQELLDRIDAYLAETGISAAKFGADAVNDPAFVYDLRAGREPRRATIQKVLGFIERRAA
jgi:hypothetical protein